MTYKKVIWCCYWHFVNWTSFSLGFHVDFGQPNIEIHLPFGFFRIGWQRYWARTPEEIEELLNKNLSFKEPS